jgi:asparagine synthase (glutamine-hydrolysing)
MAGFTAIICKKDISIPIFKFREKNLFGNEREYSTTVLSSDSFSIEHFTHRKFEHDKTFKEDDDIIIGIEGVLLNLKQLKLSTQQNDIFSVIKSLFLEKGDNFVKDLKGEFSGFIYSKASKKWLVFDNPTGSKRIFFFQNEGYFMFSSELRDITNLFHELSIPIKLDLDGAYLLLTYGYMLEDKTLISDVKRLSPGTLLTYENEKLTSWEYFNLKNIERTKDTKQQIIEKIDLLFNQALRLEFEKDKEYNYKHIATLSGGLDSRMTVLAAHKLGYTKQLNFTFSQSNYLDETISKQIASDYGHDFLFQSLDNGNYLKEIEKTVYHNDGLILYSGACHLLNSIGNINFESYGLVHTGQIGDAVLGSFLSKPYVVKPTASAGAYSTKLIHRIEPYLQFVADKYPSEELYKFYGRGFLGALNGNYYIDIYTQAVSPFLDIDFLSYCYSIPDEMKYKQQIYLEWIAEKHAEFGKYPWEKTGVSPLKSNNYKKYIDLGYYRRMSLKFFDRLSGKLKSGMNPFDFWLRENKGLNDVVEAYYHQHIDLVAAYPQLQKDCEQLFKTGNSGEKFQILTLLAAIKLHFGSK